MNCPYCSKQSKVIDSRISEKGKKRKRVCLSCKKNFLTIEMLEKKDKISEQYVDELDKSLKEEELDD